MTAELLDPQSQIRRRGVQASLTQERDGPISETAEPCGIGCVKQQPGPPHIVGCQQGSALERL